MALWGLLRSGRLLQVASLAVLVGFGASVALPSISHAEAEDSLFNKLRKKKQSKSLGVTTTQHSQGTGGKAATETGIVTDGTVSPFLLPDSSASMQAVSAKYAQIAASGGWPKVPGGNLKKGSEGNAVLALNKRLNIEGYLRNEAAAGEFAQVFTTATGDALMRFQRNHGLAATGAMDGQTLAALNVPAERRLATIRANIPRIAEYTKDLSGRYMVVNVPAQQIETVNDGRVFSRHNAIVGRPSRPTPVVMTPLTVVRFNPYWNAPASIVEKDLVPRMASKGASKVMNEMNMKIFRGVGGPEIDPDSINWRRARVDDYHFRQEPGGSNAMATAKIEFTSPHGIYLHDTPEPQLFNSFQRLYSSGCVRVEKVATLINWILQGQDGINASRIAELAETKERLDTTITNAPQLRVAYLTAWPTREGVAAFRPDVYELDKTDFIVGQPLPVGETMGGKRYVLKPIPRSQESVDEAEAFGFASLFRNRNNDKDNPFNRDGRASAKSKDTLIKTETKAKSKDSTKKKLVAKKAKKPFFGNPDNAPAALMANADDGDSLTSAKKKPLAKKKAAKATDKTKTNAKTAKAKKVLKTDEAQVAAKNPDGKDVAAKKKPIVAAKADAKPADKAKKAATVKRPAASDCKAGADGKLPAGCKPAAAATKKPAAKPEPEKTAAAN